MPTLVQIRDRVDAWLADKWPTVVARQENYLANRGRYWQGLRTHTITPAHTTSKDGDTVPDRLTQNPTDQLDNWRSAFPEWDGVPIPCTVWCDVYDGPSGKGYVAGIEIVYNGTTYRRTRNVGPLSELTRAWHIPEE